MNPPRAVPRFGLKTLGPGLITGAADDDPSGIATYSQAGAQFGYAMLWSVIFTLPFMVAIQMISARIGLVTGRGLAANIRAGFPQWVVVGVVGLLLMANTLNLSADIAAMGEALRLVIGGSSLTYSVSFGLLCLTLEVFLPYRTYVRWLKWLTLSLLSYVAVVFSAHADWTLICRSVLRPAIALNRESLLMLVALFGTTISPYLFFWQAGQEMEGSRRERSISVTPDRDMSAQLRRIRTDTVIGMTFSNLIAFFIIASAAATLHAAGIRKIETAAQAAEALRPLAGEFTFVLFSLGIVGTGLLAVPVLAGSAAYAVAEARGWKGSLDLRLDRGEGRGFYAIIGISTLGGMLLGFTSLDPVKELFWAAVLNGIIAVPIMVVMMLLAQRREVMGRRVIGLPLSLTGWIATTVMLGIVIALLAI